MIEFAELKNLTGKKIKIKKCDGEVFETICESVMIEDDEEPLLLYDRHYAIPQSHIKSIEIME